MQMSTNSPPPRPETTKVMLATGGVHGRKPTFTLHHYYETRPARTRQGAPIWEFIFKCFKHGTLRRFGCEERIEVREPAPTSPEAN
jgi:hypothetical protein